MATLIPSGITSKATTGERALFELFQSLPDDCVVYFEPYVNGRHPDFVIIAPSLGLLIIEAKGWYPGQIEKADSAQVTLVREEKREKHTHPVRQARNYQFRLMDVAKWSRHSKLLLHPDGHHLGKFLFPFAHIAVMSNMTRTQIQDKGLGEIFNARDTVSRDEFVQWQGLTGAALLKTLEPYFDPFWPITPLNEDQVKALRIVIHPEIEFGNQVPVDAITPNSLPVGEQTDVLMVLDSRQEDFASGIGEGHRVVYGVAGSGKTLILLSRAKRLAAVHPEWRILLTCYNRTLAEWLTRQVWDLENVEVKTLHQVAYRNAVEWKDENFSSRFAEALENGSKDAARYDAVLIDEAQDFEPEWFTCLLATMKDPENGDLMIVADRAQGLYRRSNISWAQLGIKARGRTTSTKFHLNQNYRNSREIIALAETFAEKSDGGPDDSIQSLRIDMSLCLRSTGASPIFISCEDRRTELDEAKRIARDLLNGEWQGRQIDPIAPEQIAFLYPGATEGQKTLLKDFLWELESEVAPAVWLSEKKERRAMVTAPGMKLQTIHSAKGLQYRAVIILWTDKLPMKWDSQEEDRRLLYVAMTRAESFLAMTKSGSSIFADDIQSCPAVAALDSPRQRAAQIQSIA